MVIPHIQMTYAKFVQLMILQKLKLLRVPNVQIKPANNVYHSLLTIN